MQNVIPTLRITDYERSKVFYTARLGFKVDWEHRFGPAYPVFVQLSRDGLILYLSQHEGDCKPGGLVYLYVSDVDAWHADLRKHGLDVPPPQDQPWGNREMRVRDPDGNNLCVCTRIAAPVA